MDKMAEQPILSICIPTYNRAVELALTIESIINDANFLNSNDIELVISNNCSTDDTDDVCRKYAQEFPDKIKYIKQDVPIFPDEHIFMVPTYATGSFVKLNNDTCVFKKDSIAKILQLLKNYPQERAFFLANACAKEKNNVVCRSLDELLNVASYRITWIGGFLIHSELFRSLDSALRYVSLKLTQVDIYAQLLQNKNSVVYNNDLIFDITMPKNKGGYNIAEVFGRNYLSILSEFVEVENGLSKKTFNEQKKLILDFINDFYFDLKQQFAFQKTGYFKFMLPFYKYNLYFYIKYFLIFGKKYFYYIYNCKKDDKRRVMEILSFIKISIKREQAK